MGSDNFWDSMSTAFFPLLEDASRYAGHHVLMDMKTFDWKRLSIVMPYEANVPGIVFLNGELYVFGGWHSSNYLKVAYKLKKNLEWERLPDMNKRRSNIGKSSVIFNGCIWVMGGFWSRPLSKATRTVEAYDPTSNTWIEKPPMNSTRVMCAAAVVSGKIFVCGGIENRVGRLATVEYYDAELSRWIYCQPLPRPSSCLIGLVYGPYLIITGVCRPRRSGDVWCMDVGEANPQWRNLPSAMSWPRCATTFGGKLVVVGYALNYDDPLKSAEIFDGQTWSSGPDLTGLKPFHEYTSISDNFAEKLLEQ